MYTRSTEIRHISSADVYKIGQILEQTNSWRKLVRIIPKNLSADSKDAAKKYNNDHVRLIENASIKQNRMSTEILFEEWGTSGRRRPTLGNLLDLLVEAELFRAADFVAVHLLNESPPERPSKGPAAKVDISLPLLSDSDGLEKFLDKNEYVGTRTLLENMGTATDVNNKDLYEKQTFEEKKVGFSELDLIEFSKTVISENIPILSDLVQRDIATAAGDTTNINSNGTETEVSRLPDNGSESTTDNCFSYLQINDDNQLPNLSALNLNGLDSDTLDQQFDSMSNDNSSSSNLTPNLSILDQEGSGSGLNDSSLTNVTETSDENSFTSETKIDSESGSLPSKNAG